MMLKISYKSITRPKLGNSIDENEDNLLEPSNSEIETDPLVRFAISDGATESSFSKEWSDLLVSSYKEMLFDKDFFSKTLRSISNTWQSKVVTFELPWYAQQKLEEGAFATFLGLTINREQSTFESVAIGDCTLFHIKEDELVLTFPVSSIEEYGNTPNLLATNVNYQNKLHETVMYKRGLIEKNDLIILSTDALAAWIFKQKDANEKPWNHLSNILENYITDFENWLNNQRKKNEIRNDDVSLIILKFQ